MKMEQRENPEVNLLIVGGKSSQDIYKLKIIFDFFCVSEGWSYRLLTHTIRVQCTAL